MNDHNPKVAAGAASNLEKDPDDWVSGDEPMTGAQASYQKRKKRAYKTWTKDDLKALRITRRWYLMS